MNLKIFLPMGLILLCSAQIKAECPDALDDGIKFSVKEKLCFKGYADHNCLNEEDEDIIKKCLWTMIKKENLDTDDALEGSNNRESLDDIISRLPNSPDKDKSKIRTKTMEVYCDNKYCPPGRLPQIICTKLEKIINVIDGNPSNRSQPICSEASNDDNPECIFETDNPECDEGTEGAVEVIDATGSSSDDNADTDDNEVVGPIEKEDPDSDTSPINPIGGGSFSQPMDPSSDLTGKFSALSPSGGTISGSRARVPGARVGEPGGIGDTGGGGQHGSRPRGLLPLRGEPGGTPKNNNGGGPSAGPGGSGGLGSAGGPAGGGNSASRAQKRRRRSSTSGSSTRYMGSPGGGVQGGKGYSPRSSSMNRRVRKKMEENKKKMTPQIINALFQRELIRRRAGSGSQSQPVFYFPDVERTYEELRDQNQFLDEKGTEL